MLLAPTFSDPAIKNKKLREKFLTHRLGITRDQLRTHEIPDPQFSQLHSEFLAAQTRGLPEEYLLGFVEFFGRRFRVTPDTIIPRAETELMIDSVTTRLHKNFTTPPTPDFSSPSSQTPARATSRENSQNVENFSKKSDETSSENFETSDEDSQNFQNSSQNSDETSPENPQNFETFSKNSDETSPENPQNFETFSKNSDETSPQNLETFPETSPENFQNSSKNSSPEFSPPSQNSVPADLQLRDIGTGSGILGLSIAANFPHFSRLVCTEFSPAALAVARENFATLQPQLSQIPEKLFLESDLLAALDPARRSSPKILVANLPYIPDQTFDTQSEPSVRDHEPRLAFVGGDDGLDLYRKMLEQIQQSEPDSINIFCEMMTRQAERLAVEFPARTRTPHQTFHFNIQILQWFFKK